MNNLLTIAALVISLFIGLSAILIAYQLQKRHRLSYLSTYLYFQIFINVFGTYGISGQVMAQRILERHQSSFQTIEMIGHFFSFLGLPFLILAWYMFLRLGREIIQKNVSRALTLGYFLATSIIFFTYGLAIIWANLFPFKNEQHAFFSKAILFLYATLEILVLAVALGLLLSNAKNIAEERNRRAVRLFVYLNILAYSTSIALSLLSDRGTLLAAVYMLVFFSANLVPLLYWKSYLAKFAIAPSLQKTGPEIMMRFLEDYKISKREEEVIQHLCAGRTNKEISEALFISLQTVKDHIYRVYQKTDVRNRVQLINLIQSYKSEEQDIPKAS